ncbi:hypothetical protein L6452_19641 [Arctium lappa]|uniref:Uncharacterized protein n=1 Tax=Arctium lappa TaxID=4217 RepID=A0ACB9BAZ0_ARCLA|nr:hypothetical protein L6452_19641 [Arctium lappa]
MFFSPWRSMLSALVARPLLTEEMPANGFEERRTETELHQLYSLLSGQLLDAIVDRIKRLECSASLMQGLSECFERQHCLRLP